MNTTEEPTLTQVMRYIVQNLLKEHSPREVGAMLGIDHMSIRRFTRVDNPSGLNSRCFDRIAQYFRFAFYHEDY